MKWFKMWFEWGHDPKVQSMPEYMRCRHVMLLCLRRQVDTSTLSDEDIATYLRIPLDELAETKKLFTKKRFIDNGWNVLAWDFRNPPSDSSADRTRRYRERLKKKESDKDVTSQKRHGDGTEKELDKEKEVEKDSGVTNVTPSSLRSCPQVKIVELYHQILPELPQVKSWPEHLKAILRQRWREDPDRQNLEWWSDYFTYVKESPFLLGQKIEFVADLEWIVRPKNMSKILNGRYHQDAKTRTQTSLEVWLEIRRRKREESS